MSQRLTLHVDNAGDLLDASAYAAGALLSIERDTSASFPAPTVLGTVALVAGTDRYEYWDSTGTSSSWYRFRVRNAAASLFSAYAAGFQVETPQQYATLADVKQRLWPAGTTQDATDDDVLDTIVRAVNAWVTGYIGYYVGPSSDTFRLLHGKDAIGGKRLWIVGGMRTVTLLEVAPQTGGAFVTATSTDYILRPYSWELGPGEPYHCIEFVDIPTGPVTYIPYGFANVRATGLPGWAYVPPDLAEWATTLAVRTFKARQTGQADLIGTDEFGNALVSRLVSRRDYATMDRFRHLTPVIA